MRLTTLGTGTVSLTPRRACAGYLVEAQDTRILFDCGSGIAHRLAEFDLPWPTITHLALTHFHVDHHGDLPTLLFAWKYGRLPGRTAPLGLIGPAGTGALLTQLAAAYGAWVTDPGFPLVVTELAPGVPQPLADGVVLEAFKVPHTPESVAYSVTAGGSRLVYTGDTGPDGGLGAWARGCSVLLSECSLPDHLAIPEHLTPERCGELAADAVPGHLVLTHLYPPVEDVDIARVVAARYTGPVTIAHDGWAVEF
ncbi:MAG TPA: ribonuclease Z [Gemmatimonadaceae bacterium]|nr:ribonuclease Z [Gemmatimonadaceae bacterium]